MDFPVRKKLPHTIPQWIPDGCWFLITINCVPRGKNQFCCANIGDAVLAAMQHNHEKLAWHCRLCLLMPDHLHAILAFPREPGMATVTKNWKKFVAGKNGVNWQRDFFDHRLHDHHEVYEKTSYILMNPVRKSLCERAEDWTWVYRTNDRPPPIWYGGQSFARRVLEGSNPRRARSDAALPAFIRIWHQQKRVRQDVRPTNLLMQAVGDQATCAFQKFSIFVAEGI